MKKAIAAIIFSFLLTGLILMIPTASEAGVYDTVVRIHVIANSDSEHDTSVKLAVRDRLLREVGKLTLNCKEKAEAEQIISENLNLLKAAADETLIAVNAGYRSEAELGHEYYPTRSYEELSLPAGNYTSLRIMLGDANGENWWCVLFPPVCLSSASAKTELRSAGLTDGQIRILTDSTSVRYIMKFRFLEIFGSLFSH